MSTGKIKYPLVSVIVPIYNEERFISGCVSSLERQTHMKIEIILVDDDSSDGSLEIEKKLSKRKNVKLYTQPHKGPGEARNLGAKNASGEILVFVDADMTFDKDFIANLITPILKSKVVGTGSTDEYLANSENFWARCWNIGRFAAASKQTGSPLCNISPNKGNFGGIFRAILKRDFDRIGGFEKGGDYTDDESLSRRLGTKAVLAKSAVFYHYNPDSLEEVWRRASWIGSGKNFTGTPQKKLVSLITFSFPISLIKAIIIAVRFRYVEFVPFKIIYDLAIWTAVLESLK